MKVCFVENTSVINSEHSIPLGSLTCEQLNGGGWEAYRLLGAQLDFFIPIEDTTASEFICRIENTRNTVDQMKAFLTHNRYYQMNDEAANTFASIETLLDKTRRQVEKKMQTGNECIEDLGIEIDLDTWQMASAYFDALYKTQAEAVQVFAKLVDAVMVQNDAYPQRRPIERLHAYGFERFQDAVRELVQESETAASSEYIPDFDMLTLTDGSVKLAPVVSINNIAQLMYHEIMNMIMQGHSIRRCKNCGRYFVQYGERIVDYCDEIPEGETKPCSVIGSSRQFTASLKDDPIKQIYTRVYKKYVARRRAQAITDTQFAEWSAEAKKLRAQAYEAQLQESAFCKQLDELMESIIRDSNVDNGQL